MDGIDKFSTDWGDGWNWSLMISFSGAGTRWASQGLPTDMLADAASGLENLTSVGLARKWTTCDVEREGFRHSWDASHCGGSS